ncbi:hypothetical protein PUMCH_002268 [Australozyma saopauloensis]|uniref:Protein FMP42 n=1 Tax=Australozyma saopauloensis TaxID=291208 RepID=A0AAX4H9L3_9ASCO|nr:hypothetical protein PUMCH_002268 [[Candida] saopauloensis]
MLSPEVSTNKRLLQCASAVFWCLLSGGPIFGFAALKPVLIKEKVYEFVCDISINGTVSAADTWGRFVMDPSKFSGVTATALGSLVDISKASLAKCTDQDLKLNMMFTVGAMVTNVSALAIGSCLDNYGPKVCGLIGAFFLYLACFVFIYGKEITAQFPILDPYLIGYASMALGGPFAYMSSFQLSNAFPEKSGTILAIITGAFDASSAVFLVYRVFYKASNDSFTLDKFFKLYLAVPVFITVAQIFWMPSDSYKTGPETTLCSDDAAELTHSSATENDALLAREEDINHAPARRDSIGDALKQPYASEGEEFLVQHSGGIFGILHGYSAHYQILTPWFFLMCFFSTIQMLRLNYFVATIGTQYSYMLNSLSQSLVLNRIFDIFLPLGGIVAIPFIGLFLDYCSTVAVLTVLLGVSLLIGVLGLIPNFYTGIMNISLFVVYRPFFYTAISDFCAKVFGFDTFGTVYGSIICISGVVNYFQSTLDKLTHTTFKMNPLPINAMLVSVTAVIGVMTVGFVKKQAEVYKTRVHAHHGA